MTYSLRKVDTERLLSETILLIIKHGNYFGMKIIANHHSTFKVL